MIIYSEKLNVYEAAKQRIHKLYDSGRHISVGFSGGKDSTVLLEITIEVAKERGISKVPVVFLDQEAEYTQTVEYMRYIMNRPEVEPYWIQCPFRLWNASAGEWFIPWEEGKEWIREKEAISYKENIYGVDRFKKMLEAVAEYHFHENYIHLGGVRIEESPARRIGLLYGPEKFPGMTYGATQKHGTVIYPIYDWSYRDIWYYIFENRVKYNKVYNQLIALRPLKMCRVSSLIHENALGSMTEIQEIDPVTYGKMYQRIRNVGTTNHIYNELMSTIWEPPNCFADWNEYLTYLIQNIVTKEYQQRFFKKLQRINKTIENWSKEEQDSIYLGFLSSVICEDFEFSQLENKILVTRRPNRTSEDNDGESR